jgi:calcineurin-like phosphoesterase family protein
MNKQIFVCSDHHFGHDNILKFEKNGVRYRPFDSLDEMHHFMIVQHNTVVRDIDTVYFLGDVVIKKEGFEVLRQLNGSKRLVRGNHDIFDDALYHQHFKRILGVKMIPERKIVMSHIPIHESCIKDDWINVHGHLHLNSMNNDRYINVCVEQLNFIPIPLDVIREKQ